MHLIDNHFGFCPCVCLSTDRLSNDYVRNSLFTDFHQILHAAQKCGCFERYCFWDKPEVDYRILRCAKSDFGSFAIVVDIFSQGSSQKPELRYN